jgi:3-methyladenine DNA glycosylase/8-oxoguanine DNA glycosylase
MPKRLSIRVPADYVLRRDVCSYGYFLLWPNHWDVAAEALSRVLVVHGKPVVVQVTQSDGRGTSLAAVFNRTLNARESGDAARQLTRMLRLDESSETIAEFHRVDPRWKRSGRGRLFRSPTLFEDVLKTVTSCNVQWPGTIQMNRRLCEVVGEQVEVGKVGRGKSTGSGGVVVEAFSFPAAKQLAQTRVESLRARCRVGYRDKRIVELATLFSLPKARGGLDQEWFEDPATGDDALFKALIDLPGVGPYAAANIMQLLGRYSRLPLDTESVRHGRTLLGFKGTSAQVMKKVHKHFAPFGRHAFRSYWFEMWEFYESKHGKAWTWERETTGRMFTAALLSK